MNRQEFSKRTKRGSGRPKVHTDDLSGMQAGFWCVISKDARSDYGKSFWTCQCTCGIVRAVYEGHLRNGTSQSCGCAKPGLGVHGKSRTSEHKIWLGMKKRALQNPAYVNRGITVCDRWKDSFANFLADMGPRPSRNHTVERINNDGNYEPSNCRWATYKEQARNTRRTRFYVIDGKRMCMAEIAEIYGVNYNALKWRLDNGRSIEEAIR